jgi:hypothetical protein
LDDIQVVRQLCTKIPYKIINLWFKENTVSLTFSRYDSIAIIRQTLLSCARNHKFIDGSHADYCIYWDDDCYLLDTDTIPKMLQWQEDIIGGTYERVYPEGVFIASKWKGTGKNYDPMGNMHEDLSKLGSITNAAYQLRKKNEVRKPFDTPMITSGGALALSQRVFMDRRLDFYPIGLPESSEDYGYCVKATRLGYKIILDNTARIEHLYTRTIEDIKPWTMIDGKYPDFVYGKWYAQRTDKEAMKLRREMKEKRRQWKREMKHRVKPINMEAFNQRNP